jgi:H+/Cl- antiporter ClcA
MPLWFGPGIALAAIGTLAFGAVLGPEVTVIALGSLVGVAVTRFVPAGTTERAMLASAGSFSAISALFGGPLVAGMMLVEGGVGMGAAPARPGCPRQPGEHRLRWSLARRSG